MTADLRARQYLLGTLDEDERDSLEKEYFAGERGLDRVSEAEDELIEDYLDDRLAEDERGPFERGYLSSPAHRVRVETIQRLIARAHSASRGDVMTVRSAHARWLGLAAAAVLLLAAGLWVFNQRGPQLREPSSTTAAERPAPEPSASGVPQARSPQQPAGAPGIFAVELTPLAVRSASDTPRVVIPARTDVVELKLEMAFEATPSANAIVTVATVSGDEVWRGPAKHDRLLAHAHVPAKTLRPDDYIVTLHAGQSEARYFLRIRPR